MIARVSVEIPTPTYIALLRQLRQTGSTANISEALGVAVEYWLAEQRRLAPGAPESIRGYQWKSVFLPEGTELRSLSYGQPNSARVEGDQIIYQGRPVSPNQFARAFADTSRNAWNDLSIRRPGESTFTLACVLRKEVERKEAARPMLAALPQPAPADPSALLLPETSIQELAIALAAALATLAPPRNTDTGPRWDLPERRKFRYRLEDVAYE
jgi:hypothetical protein